MKLIQDEINKLYYDPEFIISAQSLYSDDIWELEGADKAIKFDVFKDRPEMVSVIKRYLLFEYVQKSGNSVLRTYEGIKIFYRFIVERFNNITRFEQVNRMVIVTYFDYILSFKYKKGSTKFDAEGVAYTPTTLIHGTRFLKELYLEGIKKGIINKEIEFALEIEQLYRSIILSNPRIVNASKTRTTKAEYSEDTIKKVVTSAFFDEDLYARAIIITQTQSGARIEEVLKLEEDCITYADGKPRLRYWTRKTKLGEVLVEKPTNEVVVQVINDLIEFTKPFRNELNTKKIFVSRQNNNYGIPRNAKQYEKHKACKGAYRLISKGNVNRDYIKPFLQRWGISENGKPINYTTHYNRHFFAYLSWTQNLSIHSIQNMLNHESLSMTSTYTANAEAAMRKKFKEMIADPGNMVGPNVGNFKSELAKGNIFEGKTEAQLDAIIGVMNIQVLANGACMHHPLKAEQRLEKCRPGCYKCDRFTTHLAYLSVHKRRVARLEKVMENALELKNIAWYEKNRAEKEYIENMFIKPFEAN